MRWWLSDENVIGIEVKKKRHTTAPISAVRPAMSVVCRMGN